jgi:hypothetical protein
VSSPLNLLTPNNPFAAYQFDDNVECAQTNIQQQQGVGVVNGMTLSVSMGSISIAAGTVQNPRTVAYAGGTFSPTSNGTWYIVADWIAGTPNPSTGLSPYTWVFNIQAGATPPGGQVCLGQCVISGGVVVSVSTAGLIMLPHVSGSQWIAGQNRMVIDDLTGIATVQNLQGNVALKNVLVSGDNAIIDVDYQVLLFGFLTIPPGASLACNGMLRVIS